MKVNMKSIISVLSAIVILSGSIVSALPVLSADEPYSAVTSADYTAEELKCDGYNLEKYLTPFWEGNIVYNEVVYPITDENGQSVPLSLLYDVSEIVSVKSYTLSKTYEEGTDYTLVDGKLYINPEGNIKLIPYDYVHRTLDSKYPDKASLYIRRDGTGLEYWPETSEHSLNCLAVTYIHNDTWHSIRPEKVSDKLPVTMTRLVTGLPLKIVLVGDSVSTGCQASGMLGISPYAPAYPEMCVEGLREKFENPNVTLQNSAVGGTISSWTPGLLDSQICRYSPDLVIMNYGMNDSSFDRVGISDEDFENNMRDRIEYIRNTNPNCEFILLSSLYGNIYTFPKEKYESHAAILHKIAEDTKGVAAIDPQSIERPLLESGRKRFIDIMNDNMVHPNDFGMRLMAQSIVEAISLTDITPYANAVLSKLTGKANPFAHGSEKKAEELLEFLQIARDELYACSNEKEIKETRKSLSARLDELINRCAPDKHVFEDVTIPPTCKDEGKVNEVCTVCGFSQFKSSIPALGGEHLWDTGRQTKAPTMRYSGEISYTCAICGMVRTETLSPLSDAYTPGMLHVHMGLNYMEGEGYPYNGGDGTVEMDVCPIDTDTAGILPSNTPYIGVWVGNAYRIAATYNFRYKRFEIINVNLPYTNEGNLYASKPAVWGKGEWHKFAVNVKGTEISIYFDGELVLTASNTAFESTNDVPLIYTTGEFYLDNFKVSSGGYNHTSGTGNATVWDLDGRAAQKDFDAIWLYGSYTKLEYVVPGDNGSDSVYAEHVHSGTLVSSVSPTCTLPGWDEYCCSSCGELYRDNYTDPFGGNHAFTPLTVTTVPTPDRDGEATCRCTVCGETFTTVVPYSENESYVIGDADCDGKVNAKDVAVVMQHIVGFGHGKISETNADTNSDGIINAQDVSILQKIIAGSY